MKKKRKQSIIGNSFPKQVLDSNAVALKFYDSYTKVAGIIERVNLASGKKPVYKSSYSSSVSAEINTDGTTSTQEI